MLWRGEGRSFGQRSRAVECITPPLTRAEFASGIVGEQTEARAYMHVATKPAYVYVCARTRSSSLPSYHSLP